MPRYVQFSKNFPDGNNIQSNFTLGGFNYFTKIEYNSKTEAEELYKNRQGFYGWQGFGGSIIQWHPTLNIGFAFVPTLLNSLDMFNSRGAFLQQLVKDCTLKKRNLSHKSFHGSIKI